MPSPSNPQQDRELRRAERAIRAQQAFLNWADGPGKQKVHMDLGLRDWAMCIAACAAQAAELTADGGNGEILVLICAAITERLREVIGEAQTTWLLDLVLTMTTGLEP